MARISIDTSEVRAAVVDMTSVDSRLRPDVYAVLEKGAINVRDDLRAKMNASRHFHGASSISYDIIGRGFGDVGLLEAEIGPDKRLGKGSRGANHANIAYFGTSRGGGTVEDPEAALEREIPAFEKHMLDIAERVVFG